MIPRYSREQMLAVWSEENKFQKWLDVEIAALEAWAKTGAVPQEAVRAVKERAVIDVAKIQDIEKITHHDVIAFVEQVSETVGEQGRYIHLGLTSSDVLDTAFALILKEAGGILLQTTDALAAALKEQALRHKATPMIGRTHGVHAEPVTFGFKCAGWYREVLRTRKRIETGIEEINVGKISGAVGTYSNVPPEIEGYVCAKLGLQPELFSTQIISRDRHAAYLAALGIAAGTAERIALQIRLLQQTELGEAAEPFRKGQKGSSAMPHKRNPILSERICGLARVVRNNVGAALENMALWHERDISHSSAERIIFPESTLLLDYILHILTGIVRDLDVSAETMEQNLQRSEGLVFSQAVLTALVRKGLSRKEAYELVQRNAFSARAGGKQFAEVLAADPDVRKHLSAGEIASCCDLRVFLAGIERLFDKLPS